MLINYVYAYMFYINRLFSMHIEISIRAVFRMRPYQSLPRCWRPGAISGLHRLLAHSSLNTFLLILVATCLKLNLITSK